MAKPNPATPALRTVAKSSAPTRSPATGVSATAMYALRTRGGNQAALQSLAQTRAPNAANDAMQEARKPALKLPPLSSEMRAQMNADIDHIVRILKDGKPDSGDQIRLIEIIRPWPRIDNETPAEQRGGRSTPLLDHFLILLKMRVFTRSGLRSLWQDQYANVYDTLWYDLRGYALEEFKRAVKRSETERTEGAQSKEAENGAALIAKQEAMGMWGMLKGMGTGLVSIAGPEAAKYIGEQFDETAHILFGHEWDSSEPLIWGMNAAQIGTAGGDIIMQLTLFARSAGAKGGRILELLNNLDKLKKAQQVLAALGGVQGMLMATQGMMQLIKAKQTANEEISVAALINDPAFVNQLVMLVSSGVGTALAVKGTPASAQKAWTRAIVGGLLAGGQVAASLNELVHIARSKDSEVEKQLGYGRVLSGLIPQLVGLVISAHGANQARKEAKTEQKAIAQAKADAAAQAQQEKQQEQAAAVAPGKTEPAARTTAETPAGQKGMSQPAEPGAAKPKPSLKEIEQGRLKVGDAHQTQMADEVNKRLAPRDAPPVNAEVAAGQREPLYQAPKRGSTTVGEPHTSLAAAQALYDKVVAETGAKREVGIWHHPDTGEYIVRLGQATSVDPPGNTEWQGVLHFHPNQANVPLWRMPSGADVSELASRAMGQGRTRTELVEYPLPNGKRGRAAYTVSPEGKLTVEFVKPDGTRATKTFDGVKDFASYHPSRKVFDAESIRAEVDQWLADRRQGTLPEAEAGSKNMGAQSKQDGAPWDSATAKKQWAASEKKTVSAEESKKRQDKVPSNDDHDFKIVAAEAKPTKPSPNTSEVMQPIDQSMAPDKSTWNADFESYGLVDDTRVRAEPEQPGTFGQSTGELTGTEHRSGQGFKDADADGSSAGFHDYTEAEVAVGLRVERDQGSGMVKKVSYDFTKAAADYAGSQESSRSFTVEGSDPAAQSRSKAYADYNRANPTAKMEKGHLGQREAAKVDPASDAALGLDPVKAAESRTIVERGMDKMNGVVPMLQSVNRGKGSVWAASERRTADLASQLGSVRVEVEPVYAANPPRLSDGTPIPARFKRSVLHPLTGAVLDFIDVPNQ